MRNGICALLAVLFITPTARVAFAEELVTDQAGGNAPAVIADVAPATAISYDIPSVSADTEIFKRTPVIDGVIDEGEWDGYYTFATGQWEATTFADWDRENLYFAAKSNQPLDFLVVFDCADDGWFHGDDNYEFRTMRGPDNTLNLSVSRYESRNTKIPVATPVSAQEAARVEVKSSKSGDVYMLEMRIPAGLIPGLKLSSGMTMGCQVAVNASGIDTGWVPNNELGDTKQCKLVSKKIAALKPLVIGFDVRDTVVAQGDDVVAKFHLTNGSTEALDVRNFVIAGEGRAGEYLNSEKVRMESLAPGEHVSEDYRSRVLSDMRVGSWAAGAEVKSATGRLGSALVSFDVVEPFEVELRLPDREVRADVKDVTVGAVIRNNRRREISGVAKVKFPVGWELWRNLDQREFKTAGHSDYAVSFKARPPLGAAGDVPVKIYITCGGVTKCLEGTFRVVNP
ncbi:MAG: hypothetical protein ACYC64_00310 [Armatimonadota bacterium]